MKEAKELENAEEILELPISYEERGKEIGQEEREQEIALKMPRDDNEIYAPEAGRT